MVPPGRLDIPALDVAAVYRPAGDGTEVGGDFYDVFDIGAGRYGAIIGDVSGKGVHAALVTALARHTARAEAPRASTPSAVLASIHAAMARDHPERFVTAIFADIRPRRDGALIVFSVAGHELPVLMRPPRVCRVGTPGRMLGMVPDARRHDTRVDLGPGDGLLCWTDGVTEARAGTGELMGSDAVEALASELIDATASELVVRIAETALRFQGGVPRDDIAVLAIKVPAPTA